MLHEQTKKHIKKLSDAELIEYVMTGKRMYEAEAVDFARAELDGRNLTPEQLAKVRPAIVGKLAKFDKESPPDPIRQAGESAIVCDGCGLEVDNHYVEYLQNIGALVIRFRKTYSGHFCRRCNHRFFWKSSGVTFFMGWWGVHSIFIAAAYLVGNSMSFARSFLLRRVPEGMRPPFCDESIVEKISPHLYLISERLTFGSDASDIAREVAPLANVTPGEALCFIRAILLKQVATDQHAGRRGTEFYSSDG